MSWKIRFFPEQSTTNWASLSNEPRLLLLGQAGAGKTHLLGDVAENEENAGKNPGFDRLMKEKRAIYA